MRRLFVLFTALFSGLFLSLPAQAQDAPIRQIIQSQIDAMAANDFPRAFSFASPTIQGMFGNVQQFELMVRKGYPMVVAPRSVKMLELRTVAGNLWQRVMMVDQSGNTHLLDYMMIETPDGWQINAVQLLPSQGVSA